MAGKRKSGSAGARLWVGDEEIFSFITKVFNCMLSLDTGSRYLVPSRLPSVVCIAREIEVFVYFAGTGGKFETAFFKGG